PRRGRLSRYRGRPAVLVLSLLPLGRRRVPEGRPAGRRRPPLRAVLRRNRRIALALLVLLAGLIAAKAWHDTVAEPQVRRAIVTLAQMPTGTVPLRVVLLSDIHVAGPDMPPSRLARIVRQINALEPDLVLIAGDLVSDKRIATRHYPAADAIAPLGQLRPTLATVAVPGNHDHWRDIAEVRRELRRHGIVVLANEAQRFGPLAIG